MSNTLITMTKDELNIPACDNNINTNEKISDNLNYNFYRNESDLYNQKNGNSVFVTNSNTIHPNNLDEVKNFLYNIESNNCKTGGVNCMNWYDIKYGT